MPQQADETENSPDEARNMGPKGGFAVFSFDFTAKGCERGCRINETNRPKVE